MEATAGSGRANPTWAIIGAALLVLLIGGGIVFWRVANPERVPAPASFTQFKAGDQSFQCEYPAGWDSSGASSGAIASGAHFQKASAMIDVTSDLTGSLMGDIARASSQQ